MNSNRGSWLLGAAFGSAFLLALSAGADAADIYDGGFKGGYEVDPPPPTERGIYFKGYIGMANPSVDDFTTDIIERDGDFTKFHKDLKSGAFYGIGIGYQRNHWLRFDGTIEYRGSVVFLAQDSYPDPVAPGTNEYTADVSSWLGLANAYIDMGTWCGFTPYLGAGIGFATLSVEGLKDVNVPRNSVFYGEDRTNTNFAWALHAGVSYDVSPQFAVDLAYRFADLGDAKSGRVTAYNGAGSYSRFEIKDVTSNDLLLGVRYKLQREQPALYAVK